jgi:predicted O-methyltransferase YrrM
MQIAAPDALIVSVDLPGGDFGGGYDERQAAKIAGYRKPEQRLELIAGDSHDASVFLSVIRLLNSEPVDLVFIDGDHSYDGVRKDWLDYGQLGGLVGFHDIVFHPMQPTCQVDRLWGELREEHRVTEFVDRKEAWGGIGVIER